MSQTGPRENGRVTVVMPTYNRAALLPKAIRSALNQTVAHLCDIVVVDDGSTDNTRQVAAGFGTCVRYIYQQNAGLAAARNTAIRASRSEFVAFLDDDDEWEPDKTERQLDAFRRWPEAVLVAGRATARYADGRTKPRPLPPIPLNRPTDFAPRLFENNFLSVPMVLVRRQCLERAGLHREELRRRQDYDMWVRLACLGPCVYLDVPVATYAADTARSLSEDRTAAMLANLHVRRLLKRELRRRPDCLGSWRRGMAHCLAILRDLAYRDGRFAAAARFGFESLLYRPRSRPAWEWGRLLSALWRAVWPTAARSPRPAAQSGPFEEHTLRSMPRTVQIQVLTAHRALGGGARHARSLACGLRQLGVRVSLLCTGTCDVNDHADYDEIMACQPRSWSLLWRFQPFGSLPFWYRTVREAAAHVDAVIALSAPLAVATRWALPRMPLLYAPAMLHKLEYPRWRSAYAWFERRAFRCADGVLVRTRAVREAIEALYGPLPSPIGICLPGLDDDHASGATRTRADLGVPADAKLLVTVGLANENKGQRHIARALARCAEPNWWWALVGRADDGPAVRRELRGSSIASRTLFVGAEKHVQDWYAAADLYVGASQSETFGQAIAESLHAGLPVVIPENVSGTTLSPLAEVVERYRLGYTFRRGDAASLINVLQEALGDGTRLRATGRRAAAFARINFACARYAECALRLFESASNVVYETVAPETAERRGADDAPALQLDRVLTAAR